MMMPPPAPMTDTSVVSAVVAKPSGATIQTVPWESDSSMIMRCVFCRGAACRSCSKDAILLCTNPAFPGLHSNWIAPNILAMQRPSSRGLIENKLLEKFTAAGIKAVFNCTVQGEHPLCGDGILEKTGFSYDPEEFQKNGIEYYQFGWEDMTVPSIALMQNIVRIAAAVIYRGGKIAVHCHAGFGRTGIVIACVLMLTEGISADDAIVKVRENRPRSIQTRFQEAFVREFQDHILDIGTVFRKSRPISYPDAVNNQLLFMHGETAKHTRRWVAQPLFLALRALQALATTCPDAVANALVGVGTTWGPEEELLLEDLKEAANHQEWHNWEDMVRVAQSKPNDLDPRIPTQLIYDYLDNLKDPLLFPDNCIAETKAAADLGLLSGSATNLVEAAQNLECINGCHHSVLCTLEKITELLRTVDQGLMARSLGNTDRKNILLRVHLRMGIALMHLEKLYGPLILNGRDLNHISAYADFKRSSSTTLRILDSSKLSDVLQQMDMVGKFVDIFVNGWQMVPKTMVGSPGRTPGSFYSYLPPLFDTQSTVVETCRQTNLESGGKNSNAGSELEQQASDASIIIESSSASSTAAP